MRQAIDRYLETVRQTKAASTYVTYKQSLDLFAKSIVKDASDVSSDDLQEFVKARKAAGDGARTVHNRFLHVVIFLRACGNKNLPKRSAYPKKFERTPEEYSPRQLSLLLEAATDEEKLLVEVFLCSGMRNKELANLQVGDLDFEASALKIRLKEHWAPKSGREREVPLPRWLSEKLYKFRTGKRPDEFVFPNSQGGANHNLLRIVKRVARRAELGGRVDCHKFRSTFACQLLRSGASVQDVMQQVGHNSLTTTTRYLALANRTAAQQKAEQAFGGFGQ